MQIETVTEVALRISRFTLTSSDERQIRGELENFTIERRLGERQASQIVPFARRYDQRSDEAVIAVAASLS